MITADDRFAFFDGDDGGGLLLTAYQRTIGFDGQGAPDTVLGELEALAARGQWIAIATDYGLGACFEPSVPSTKSGHPLLRAWVFDHAQTLSADETSAFFDARLRALPEYARVSGIAELHRALDSATYVAKVEQIQRWIADGECYQINLTFPLDFKLYGHPLALYAQLRRRQPVRYGAFVSTPEQTLLSFSPELFFERIGRRVVTRPMKGTAPRGATPADDEAKRSALLASTKERAENIMIVDLLRNDLGRVARPGKVRVDALCAAEAYPTVWQLVSTISADLPGVTLSELFRTLFPCGSITGAPKIRSMQLIDALEDRPRGVYTGALGWLAPSGDCRFNVAIRTLEVEPDGKARMGVGSGVVIDAKADQEYRECLLKARFLTGHDPGFALIETMRLQDGAYPLLALHLERLASSALALGFALDLGALRTALAEKALICRNGLFRLRLTLTHGGDIQIHAAPLPEEGRSWSVVVSEERLAAEDYLLRHKTTARSRYDRVLASLPAGVFDAVFLNERGEVCEGARSNIFVERDGVLLTPPLACGLLPGVMRRHLLESGRAVERLLSLDDLRSASAIFLSNALRGLIPVSLVCPNQ